MTLALRLILLATILVVTLIAVQAMRDRDVRRIKMAIGLVAAVIFGIGTLLWFETAQRGPHLAPTPELKQLRADAETTLDQVQPTSFDNVKTCLGYLNALAGFYAEHANLFAADLNQANQLRDRYQTLTAQQAAGFCSDETELYQFLQHGKTQLKRLVVRSG